MPDAERDAPRVRINSADVEAGPLMPLSNVPAWLRFSNFRSEVIRPDGGSDA